jgi:hypothetical protein
LLERARLARLVDLLAICIWSYIFVRMRSLNGKEETSFLTYRLPWARRYLARLLPCRPLQAQ